MATLHPKPNVFPIVLPNSLTSYYLPLSQMMEQVTTTTMEKLLVYANDTIIDRDCQKAKKFNNLMEADHCLYDNLEETQLIQVADGHVSLCRHFKYLQLFISYNLKDDYDVEKQISAASKSMGALKNVWNCPHLDIWNKYQLFRAIHMNLLWGCETWSMRRKTLFSLRYSYM